MKVFAIIVTYNGEQWLDRCFASLQGSDIPLHTIVVDNLSSDSTLDRLSKDYPEVQLIKNDFNAGFGCGNNMAIKVALAAGADYVLLLNQDAWIFPDTVSRLIEAGESNPKAGIISPVHIDASEESLDRSFEYYTRNCGTKILSRSEYLAHPNKTRPYLEVDFVNAAAWLLPRKTLDTVGGFAPIFFHYGEDNNYSQRVIYHKLKTIVAPSAFAVHDRAKVLDSNDNTCRWFRSYLLVEYCNINHSMVSIFFRTLIPLLKILFNAAFGLRPRRENARFGLRNFSNALSQIRSTRQASRKCLI
ncbi:MAG: glycosyltransferase family 2 protein [Rikenellaceae bacterium]